MRANVRGVRSATTNHSGCYIITIKAVTTTGMVVLHGRALCDRYVLLGRQAYFGSVLSKEVYHRRDDIPGAVQSMQCGACVPANDVYVPYILCLPFLFIHQSKGDTKEKNGRERSQITCAHYSILPTNTVSHEASFF